MFKLKVNVICVLFLFTIIDVFAQNENSIQLNAGLLYPRSSSNGFSTFIKYNYDFSSGMDFYIYTGYSSFNKFKVTYISEATETQNEQLFSSYSADEHIMIPVYLGTAIKLHTNKLFTTFIDVELGYTYLNYNSYDNYAVTDDENGDVVSYEADISSKKEITDNLFGIGLGFGLLRPLTEKLDIILSYKLNSNFNSGEFGIFSARGTYYTIYVGLSIKL